MTAHPSITCPRCGRTSYNSNDIREGYCGACNDWTSPRAAVAAARLQRPAIVARMLDGFERGLLEQAIPVLRAEHRHAFADVLQAILDRFPEPRHGPEPIDQATLTRLRELAEAVRATPATWPILISMLRTHVDPIDLRFIEACSPDTILRLVQSFEAPR